MAAAPMKREAYAAAQTVSGRLHEYFARHHAEARALGRHDLAPLPDSETIEVIIDATFWASLRREEGYTPRISLAFLPPAQSPHPLVLHRAMPLDPGALARVAPAVERSGIHLGVWREAGELCVWGTTRVLPIGCFVLEVAAPGLLVIKHHSQEGSRKFVNVAVLEGDRIKIVDEHSLAQTDCPDLVKSLLGFHSAAAWVRSTNTMVRLAVSMRAHGRGGALLVVPAGTDSWRESIVQPLAYSVSPPFRELADLSAVEPMEPEPSGTAVAAIAGLTAVDGAVVITDRYELLGFGAKIARRKGHPQIEQVALAEPVEGGETVLVHPDQLGGTRHLSAAQFIQDQHDAAALVASQDGHFTAFEWSHHDRIVRADRLDVLLL